ncbi:MAG TPA: GlxA family transcriptional regulator [Rhizomicrobium sp.]|jgi:transcriptional regulator GlxA family with amidase domain|nr:GlxA family transcriptional regulator [Rhizomicrobium sp.]
MQIGLLLPPGFAVLSFAPLATFEAVNMVLGKTHYDVHVVSSKGGALLNSFGMTIKTQRAYDLDLDTLLVGSPPDTRRPPKEVTAYLRLAPSRVRRIASICAGAFVIGEAGLLDGRRSTTHWMFGKELQARFPRTKVEIDRIFITDGQIWTSAGMTAGIDLALGLVERDLGTELAREAARTMVVHHRRSGGQSQHSALLEIDGKSDRVQQALEHARHHLNRDLSVETLAKVACLSARQFARIFRSETGMTPAKAIENLRLERARYLLQQSRLPVGVIAEEAGFGDRERMRRSFQRTFGEAPQTVRNAAPPLASA